MTPFSPCLRSLGMTLLVCAAVSLVVAQGSAGELYESVTPGGAWQTSQRWPSAMTEAQLRPLPPLPARQPVVRQDANIVATSYALPAPCASCDSWYEPTRSCGYFSAGYAFVAIQPHFQEDTAMILDPPPSDNIGVPFRNDYELSQRVWLAYTAASGWGVRGRYWNANLSADPFVFSVPAGTGPAFIEVTGVGGSLVRSAFASTGETYTASHRLRLNVGDIEATRQFRWQRATLLVGFGIRFVDMDQRFEAVVTNAGGGIDEQLTHRHSFEGHGPTLSCLMTQPIFSSRFSFYGGGRWSILFGDVEQDIVEVKLAGAQVGHDVRRGSETMGIGELEFGLQYAWPIGQRWQALLRAGYEGQVWFDAGGPLATTGDMGLEGLGLSLEIAR